MLDKFSPIMSLSSNAASCPSARPTTAHAIIADDHPLFRTALRQTLQETLVGQVLDVDNFSELMESLQRYPHLELVLMDLNMPGNQGLTGLTAIRNQYPDVQVIIVSANEQVGVIERAMSFGASAYVPKSTPLPLIVQAVETVLAGDSWLPQHLHAAVNHRSNTLHQTFALQLNQLTPQQFKVLRCMADGMLNKQIAFELDVQETTIKQHVSAILRKLGVINRTQAGVLFHDMLRADDADNSSESNAF
jgi:DNA-binding NarL/FixJ family response regulator